MNATESIIKNKIIAIARGIYGEDLKKLSLALQNGGVSNIEITFVQSDPECIKKTCDGLSLLNNIEGLCVGAGTVLNLEQLYAAHSAGAKYIVSPSTNLDLIKATKAMNMVSIPGAITPTEIVYAKSAGADFVKIFPAAPIGLDYIKAVCIPLSNIGFIANAGIEPDNIQDFFDAGFIAAGISNYLCNKELINNHNWTEIEKRAKIISDIVAKYNK